LHTFFAASDPPRHGDPYHQRVADPFVSSDPNAWLRSYGQRLQRQQSFFANLAPELQANALAEALEEDHPARAAAIREWNATTRRAMIAVLDQALKAEHTARQTELWRMRKGEREVRCVAVYTSVGVDLRLLEGEEMLRTVLFRESFTLRAGTDQWRKAMLATGWKESR
jgi:hypothetical protein